MALYIYNTSVCTVEMQLRKGGSVSSYAHRPVSKNYVLEGIILAYACRPVSKNWGAKAYKLHYLYI